MPIIIISQKESATAGSPCLCVRCSPGNVLSYRNLEGKTYPNVSQSPSVPSLLLTAEVLQPAGKDYGAEPRRVRPFCFVRTLLHETKVMMKLFALLAPATTAFILECVISALGRCMFASPAGEDLFGLDAGSPDGRQR